MVPEKLRKPVAVIGTVGASMAPALALAEGETSTGDISGVTTAITGAATTVQTSALSMIQEVLPVLAPVMAAIIIATLGFRLVRRFSK